MKALAFLRYALNIGAAALLAACAGSQPPIGAPGAMPQSRAIATHATRAGSWMLPEAKSKDLIYATSAQGTYVLSYPDGTVVGDLATQGTAACSDSIGNVFISTPQATVEEYAHGGKTPTRTLNIPGTLPLGCSVDSKTGNLAVVFRGGTGEDIAIFANATGGPALYTSQLLDASYCSYDDKGNLFIDGFNEQYSALSEIPVGSSNTVKLTIKGDVGQPGQVQWDGAHMTYESIRLGYVNVERLRISGTTATVIGKTHFRGLRGNASQSWIWNDLVFIPFGVHAQQPNIGVWKYPQGGKPEEKFGRVSGAPNFQGVTPSVKP